MATSLLQRSAAVESTATGAEPRLRVAVVSPEFHRTGGTERATAELIRALSRDHGVCLYSVGWSDGDSPIVCHHRVRVLPGPAAMRHLNFYAAASLAVWRGEQRHGSYDCVYSPGANCAQVNVSTAHFCQARQLDFLRSGQHRPRLASAIDWLKLGNRWSFAWMASGLERHFYQSQQLDRVVAVSRLLANDLGHYYGLPESKLRVSHSGVKTTAFDPAARLALRSVARAELGLTDDRFAFFFIGNNWLIKGLYHVLRALAEVPEVQLFVVGADVERRESWVRFSLELGIAGRVHYLPRRSDVLFYYAAADALLAPSLYDTFALMPLEATACGLPVIITRQMGVAEVLDEDSAIVLDDPTDSAALARAMRRLKDDPELRRRLVFHGGLRARMNPWDGINQATLDAIRETASRRKAAAVRYRSA